MLKEIKFNIPCVIGDEIAQIKLALQSRELSGNGKYTELCHTFFKNRYGFKKGLSTKICD